MADLKHQDHDGIDPEETSEMTTSSQQQSAEAFYDDYDDGFGVGEELPQRPRAKFLSPITAALMALILGGVGFFVGIRVEKSQAGTAGGATAFAARGGATSARRGATSARAGATSKTGSSAPTGGFAGAPGAAGGASSGTAGTVSSIDGNTLYVKETDGNLVKVKLTGSTTVTKTDTVSKKKIDPGDSVTVVGASGSGGTVSATSVSDSGASDSSASSSTSSSGSTTTSSVSSLFGS